jgi:acyl-CoA thioester hydrolase
VTQPNPFVAQVQVRLNETDEFGVVWHGHYVTYFEVARTEMARAFGLTAKDLRSAGFFPPVIDYSVQCRLPAKNDDVLFVACTVDPIENASITIRYRISRKSDGVLIATGHTRQAMVNEKGFLLFQLPPELEVKVKALAAAHPA